MMAPLPPSCEQGPVMISAEQQRQRQGKQSITARYAMTMTTMMRPLPLAGMGPEKGKGKDVDRGTGRQGSGGWRYWPKSMSAGDPILTTTLPLSNEAGAEATTTTMMTPMTRTGGGDLERMTGIGGGATDNGSAACQPLPQPSPLPPPPFRRYGPEELFADDLDNAFHTTIEDDHYHHGMGVVDGRRVMVQLLLQRLKPLFSVVQALYRNGISLARRSFDRSFLGWCFQQYLQYRYDDGYDETSIPVPGPERGGGGEQGFEDADTPAQQIQAYGVRAQKEHSRYRRWARRYRRQQRRRQRQQQQRQRMKRAVRWKSRQTWIGWVRQMLKELPTRELVRVLSMASPVMRAMMEQCSEEESEEQKARQAYLEEQELYEPYDDNVLRDIDDEDNDDEWWEDDPDDDPEDDKGGDGTCPMDVRMERCSEEGRVQQREVGPHVYELQRMRYSACLFLPSPSSSLPSPSTGSSSSSSSRR